MNGQKMYELMLDGAYWIDDKFFHPSFKKGWRKIRTNNMSLAAAMKKADKVGGKWVGENKEKYTIV